MITLTKEQAAVLLAFISSFDDVLTGCWKPVSDAMTETHGIEDPEYALENAKLALQG